MRSGKHKGQDEEEPVQLPLLAAESTGVAFGVEDVAMSEEEQEGEEEEEPVHLALPSTPPRAAPVPVLPIRAM